MTGRLSGVLVNYDKLIRVGIPGLINEVENGLDRACGHGPEMRVSSRAWTSALCLLIDIIHHYGNQARGSGGRAALGARRRGVLCAWRTISIT
ncbi:MAG: hypothetical protein R3F07_12730 [Opitutaceae bacterium]